MERWAPSVHPETSPMLNSLEWEGMYTSLAWEKDVFAICVYVVSPGVGKRPGSGISPLINLSLEPSPAPSCHQKLSPDCFLAASLN